MRFIAIYLIFAIGLIGADAPSDSERAAFYKLQRDRLLFISQANQEINRINAVIDGMKRELELKYGAAFDDNLVPAKKAQSEKTADTESKK